MSEENVELARQFYPGTVDAVAVFDDPALIDAIASALHPEFEMVGEAVAMDTTTVEDPEQSARRTAHGIDGFVDSWRDFLVAWETCDATAIEFIDVDAERVLVLIDVRARSRTHGVVIPTEGANLLTFREGKIARLELFPTRPPALKAAGLSE